MELKKAGSNEPHSKGSRFTSKTKRTQLRPGSNSPTGIRSPGSESAVAPLPKEVTAIVSHWHKILRETQNSSLSTSNANEAAIVQLLSKEAARDALAHELAQSHGAASAIRALRQSILPALQSEAARESLDHFLHQWSLSLGKTKVAFNQTRPDSDGFLLALRNLLMQLEPDPSESLARRNDFGALADRLVLSLRGLQNERVPQAESSFRHVQAKWFHSQNLLAPLQNLLSARFSLPIPSGSWSELVSQLQGWIPSQQPREATTGLNPQTLGFGRALQVIQALEPVRSTEKQYQVGTAQGPFLYHIQEGETSFEMVSRKVLPLDHFFYFRVDEHQTRPELQVVVPPAGFAEFVTLPTSTPQSQSKRLLSPFRSTRFYPQLEIDLNTLLLEAKKYSISPRQKSEDSISRSLANSFALFGTDSSQVALQAKVWGGLAHNSKLILDYMNQYSPARRTVQVLGWDTVLHPQAKVRTLPDFLQLPEKWGEIPGHSLRMAQWATRLQGEANEEKSAAHRLAMQYMLANHSVEAGEEGVSETLFWGGERWEKIPLRWDRQQRRRSPRPKAEALQQFAFELTVPTLHLGEVKTKMVVKSKKVSFELETRSVDIRNSLANEMARLADDFQTLDLELENWTYRMISDSESTTPSGTQQPNEAHRNTHDSGLDLTA